MAVMQDKYPNLPGHLTEFKDGGLQLIQEVNPPKTESVLILGTSVDGPIMEPVKVDASTFEAVFGKATDERGIPNGSTATIAFEEAYAAGCRDIRIMRVSGSEAKAILKGEATTIPEEKVFEGLIGMAAGNVAENSKIMLSEEAEEVKTVEAGGVILSQSNYTVSTGQAVDGVYIDEMGAIYDTKDVLDEVVMVGTKTVVEITQEDLYRFITTEEQQIPHFKWASQLIPEGSEEPVTTGYELVAQDNEDYVKKGAVSADDAFLEVEEAAGVPNIEVEQVKAVLVNGEYLIVEPFTTTAIEIKTGATDAGALLKVTYKTARGTTKVENSSIFTPAFVAKGEKQVFELVDENGKNIVPKESLTRLYIQGAEYTENDTTVESSDVKVFEISTVDGVSKLTLNPGKHAKKGNKLEVRCAYTFNNEIVPELKLETSFGGELYNETQYIVEHVIHSGGVKETLVKVIKPRSKREQVSEEPLTYSSFDSPTLGLLARAINNDARNGAFVKAYVSTDFASVPVEKLEVQPTPKNFEDGDNGINISKQDLFSKLSGRRDDQGFLVEPGAYQILENYTVDYVVPAGVAADESLVGRFDNFAYELALYCAVASHRNHSTIGVIATSSPSEPTLKGVEDHVKKLEAFDNLYLMRDAKGEVIRDKEGEAIDLGKFINVLAGGDMIMFNQRLGQYATNSAAAFAGYLSQLAVNSAPTNKVLPFAKGLRVKYSNHQLDRLTEKRFITLKYKGDGATVAVVDAMTASAPGSDYARTATMRAVRELANEIREVADPFLGEPNTTQQRNALSALLDKRLGLHKEAGTMKDYAFQLIATPFDELVGQATIELTIVPAQELRRITTVISLKPSI